MPILPGGWEELKSWTIKAVWIGVNPAPDWFSAPSEQDDPRYTFGELDPISASEVLADLTALTANQR